MRNSRRQHFNNQVTIVDIVRIINEALEMYHREGSGNFIQHVTANALFLGDSWSIYERIRTCT